MCQKGAYFSLSNNKNLTDYKRKSFYFCLFKGWQNNLVSELKKAPTKGLYHNLESELKLEIKPERWRLTNPTPMRRSASIKPTLDLDPL